MYTGHFQSEHLGYPVDCLDVDFLLLRILIHVFEKDIQTLLPLISQ